MKRYFINRKEFCILEVFQDFRKQKGTKVQEGCCTQCLFQNRVKRLLQGLSLSPKQRHCLLSSTAWKYLCFENQMNTWKNKITMLIHFKCVEGGKCVHFAAKVNWHEWKCYSWLEQTHTDCKDLLSAFYGVLVLVQWFGCWHVEGNLFWTFSMSRDWYALTQTLQNGVY